MERFDFGSAGADDTERLLRVAADALGKDGVCALDAVVDPGRVRTLRGEFERGYSDYVNPQGKADALEVGDLRFMVTTEMSGSFADPAVYANDVILGVVRAALAPDCILENFGVVVSLPGSKQQHIHRDGTPLFPNQVVPNQVVGLLPAYAVTVAIPLVEMNDSAGTTEVLPRTHRYQSDATSLGERPIVPVGSCVLWDYRLLHGGTPNLSDGARPIIYMTYSLKWWRDADNFTGRQLRLALPEGFLDDVPDHAAPLFAHV